MRAKWVICLVVLLAISGCGANAPARVEPQEDAQKETQKEAPQNPLAAFQPIHEAWKKLVGKTNGHPATQFGLAAQYHHGIGVAQDHAQALHWYRLAAEQGHADAQFNVGMFNLMGLATEQDFAQSAHWLQQAAKQDHTEAQVNLGFLYEQGWGVPQDYAQAMRMPPAISVACTSTAWALPKTVKKPCVGISCPPSAVMRRRARRLSD